MIQIFLPGVLLLSFTKCCDAGLFTLPFVSDKEQAWSSLRNKAWMNYLFTNVSVLSVFKYVIDYDILLQVI